MNREYNRRAAILESLRAGKSPSQIIAWFGYKETQVYDLAKKFRDMDKQEDLTADRASHKKRSDCKRNAEFVAELKEKIDQDGGRTMTDLAKEMGVARSTISLAVHEVLQYNSFVLRNRQLLTEKNKMDRKVKAQALLNDIKHDSAGFLRFFSDEKNFIQDRKVNRQNDRWICQNASDGLKVDADSYINVLEVVVKPWMDKVANGREYVFQQDSAPSHKEYTNLPYHWSPDLWPPSSPDCNPLDYYVWGVVEAKVNAKHHNTKDALKASITEVMTNMDKEEVTRACSRFRSRLEKVVAADGGYIE